MKKGWESKGKGKKNKFKIRNGIRFFFLLRGLGKDLLTFGKDFKRKNEKEERKDKF